jgi:hypothetical protein
MLARRQCPSAQSRERTFCIAFKYEDLIERLRTRGAVLCECQCQSGLAWQLHLLDRVAIRNSMRSRRCKSFGVKAMSRRDFY